MWAERSESENKAEEVTKRKERKGKCIRTQGRGEEGRGGRGAKRERRFRFGGKGKKVN